VRDSHDDHDLPTTIVSNSDTGLVRPAVIAHRGASAAAAENTVGAFRLARLLGADWVELDVRLAPGDALVVCHDASYPGGGLVNEVPIDRRPAGVPLLVQALDACAGMGVNVEVKNLPGEPGHDPAARVVEVLAALLAESRCRPHAHRRARRARRRRHLHETCRTWRERC
jgi:glycerophosphoryl diester phosphodiesterase